MLKTFHEQVLDEIAEERVVSSRGRHIPRGVKQKMSNYPIRARDTVPTKPVEVRVIVAGGIFLATTGSRYEHGRCPLRPNRTVPAYARKSRMAVAEIGKEVLK